MLVRDDGFRAVGVVMCLNDLIRVLGVLIQLKVADLNDGLVLARIDSTETHVDGVCIVRANVYVLVLTTWCLRDVHGVLVTFFLFIRLDR